MGVKSFFKRLIFGSETIDNIDSEINGEILIAEDIFGRREMIIGKVCQSGGLVKKLWKTVLSFKFVCRRTNFKRCLILGLGTGTIAKLIAEKFPQTKIIGVEIDPKVVEIGKKYFDLDKIPNLKIIVGDAFEIINNPKFGVRGSKFDLILVDLYLGQEFPPKAETEDFLKNIKKMLVKSGLVVFNRLYFNKKHQQKAGIFLEKVKQVYLSIKIKKSITNLIILTSLEAKNEV